MSHAKENYRSYGRPQQTYGRHRQRVVSIDVWGDNNRKQHEVFSFSGESYNDTSSSCGENPIPVRGKRTTKSRAAKSKGRLFDDSSLVENKKEVFHDSSSSTGGSGIFSSGNLKSGRVLRDRSTNKPQPTAKSTKKPKKKAVSSADKSQSTTRNSRPKLQTATTLKTKCKKQIIGDSVNKYESSIEKSRQNFSQFDSYELMMSNSPIPDVDKLATPDIEVRDHSVLPGSTQSTFHSTPQITQKQKLQCCLYDHLVDSTADNLSNLSQIQTTHSPNLPLVITRRRRANRKAPILDQSVEQCTRNMHSLTVSHIAHSPIPLDSPSVFESEQGPHLYQNSTPCSLHMENIVHSSSAYTEASPHHELLSIAESDISSLRNEVRPTTRHQPDFSFVTGRKHRSWKKGISLRSSTQPGATSVCSSEYDASKSLFERSTVMRDTDERNPRFGNQVLPSVVSRDVTMSDDDVESGDVTRYQLVDSSGEDVDQSAEHEEITDEDSDEDGWKEKGSMVEISEEELSDEELSEEESAEEEVSEDDLVEELSEVENSREDSKCYSDDLSALPTMPVISEASEDEEADDEDGEDESGENGDDCVSDNSKDELSGSAPVANEENHLSAENNKHLTLTPCHSRPKQQYIESNSVNNKDAVPSVCLTCNLIQQNTPARTNNYITHNTPARTNNDKMRNTPARTNNLINNTPLRTNNHIIQNTPLRINNQIDRNSFKTPCDLLHLNRLRDEALSSAKSLQVLLTPLRLQPSGNVVPARDKVLHLCDQTQPMSFTECIPPSMMRRCKKIGEGVYGEVFRSDRNHKSVALKVIPIEGDILVNDEKQKSFAEILPEIVISKELSALQDTEMYCTPNFVDVKGVSVVQGGYPDILLKQWDIYHAKKISENDRPDVFDENQLFLVFEFEDCGCDLESIQLTNLQQAKSILCQVTCSLAISEQCLQFEHRDLHWGNVLVRPLDVDRLHYRLGGEQFQLESHGMKVAVIDFTLSRLSKDGCNIFTDLSVDPTLFEGYGDYQFDVYRLMKDKNRNEWESFEPHTNVLWINYIADKLFHSKSYGKVSGKEHQALTRQFRTFKREATNYDSALHLLMDCPFFEGVMLPES